MKRKPRIYYSDNQKALMWERWRQGDGSYETGDLIEVYDLKKRLRCLIRATDVQTIRFGDIAETAWRGEGFASAHEFQEVHIRCLPQYELG